MFSKGVTFLVTYLLATVSSSQLEIPGHVAVFPEQHQERASSRIVSGWLAEEGQFPYQISIRMVNGQGQVNACGGSIIHPEWGLTAAHCTATRLTFVVRAGGVNLTRPGLLFETNTFYNHPLYNNNLPGVVQPHDIGLLKFNRVLTFTDRIQPVRMQPSVDQDRNYDGERLTATGWGITWTQGSSPEVMNWVFLRGVSNQFCRSSFGGSSIIVDSTICARYYNVTSQSTCQGDSGGALTVVDTDGEISQVGVSSFVSSLGCHVDIPAGFIRPGHYHDWYTEVTGIDFDWTPEPKPTTAEPEPEPTTEVPEPEPTTAEPEPEPTTEVPEPEPTTEVPETESESEADTKAQLKRLYNRFRHWFV